MGARPSNPCLCLTVLAALWTGGTAPAWADPRPGQVGFSVSLTADSGIPLAEETLARWVCGDPPSFPPPSTLVHCRSTAKNNNARGRYVERALLLDQLQISNAEPLETDCGLWDFTLTLDPTVPQALAPLALEEIPGTSGNGVFAGVLELHTVLQLVHRETGETVDFPLRLGLSLAGPWTLDPAPESPDASDLILFAESVDGKVKPSEGCGPVWSLDDSSIVGDSVEAGCGLCFTHFTPYDGPLR